MSQFHCDHNGVHEIEDLTSGHIDPAGWLVNSFTGGVVSDAGIVTTPRNILSHVPILQGITILAGDVGMLPLQMKRRTGENQTQDEFRHVAYRLAAVRPNPLMLPNAFWELTMLRAILYGNGISEIARDPTTGNPEPGRISGLTPLVPEKTRREFDDDGKLWIVTRVRVGRDQEESRAIDPADTLHLKGLSDDGFWGLSLRQVAQESIGYGLALKKHGNVTFRNRAQPDLLLEHPGRLTEPAAKNLRDSWNRIHQGLDNVSRMAILEEGMVAKPWGQNNRDAMWIEAQKFNVDQSASILNLPAHKLNSLDKATFSNIEEQNRWYINQSLSRWLNKITQELAAKLLTEREQTRFFFQFNLDQLLKGTFKERMEGYAIGISAMVINSNEARAQEGMNPRDGGDEFQNPNTMTDGGGADDADDSAVSDRVSRLEAQNTKLLAWNLRECVKIEDQQVRRAARGEKNFCRWLDNFYQTEFPNRLIDLIGKDIAYEYCVERHELWLNVSGKVDSTASLVDAVDQMKGDVRERGRELLNKELMPCG